MTVVTYRVGADADNGCDLLLYEYYYYPYIRAGYVSDGQNVAYIRWPGVTIPDGATIVKSYITYYRSGESETPPTSKIYFVKAANPAQIADHSDAISRTKTTQYISYSYPSSGSEAKNTGSLNVVIEELTKSYSYSSGAAMMAVIVPDSGSGDNYFEWMCYPNNPSYAPLLYIEYTEAASGKPIYAYAQQ